MPRSDWTDLPDAMSRAITARTGPVLSTRSAPTGNHADVAITVRTADGAVFVKAARKLDADRDGPEVWSLRRESAIAPHAPPLAPRLLWQEEAGGWMALGFEHVPGRTAVFTPGSPDLDLLAQVVHTLQDHPCPDAVDLNVEQRWANLTDDVSPMAGDTLLHTDLNPKNLIIDENDHVHVVDWALTSRGAPWIEIGQLIPWLILDGHSPTQAEAWATRFTSWSTTPPPTIDLYSHLATKFWQHRSDNHPAPWMPPYLDAWKQWTTYRTHAP
ncbi:phosphotransferase family protein [Actinomadura flavalba]|uniref:phosphotransferase family protein n=1 Tax=Actinomadura flavalba TaxID=1120938 RepID=UPI00036F856F|nr:phosphotransferase [Actinomadura flavalba]